MKICKDCKYSKLHLSASRGYLCMRACEGKVDLVTGVQSYAAALDCAFQRDLYGPSCCGHEGRFFEAKHVKISFWKKLFN